MTAARIAPLQTPLEGDDARRMATLIPPSMTPPQLFLIAARHRRLWSAMVDGGLIGPTGLMDLGTLDRRLREMVILRTCVANRCHYEFNLHVQTISERMGLDRERIDDLRRPAPSPALWSDAEFATIALVDALVARREVDDGEFAAARAHFDDETLIELANLVGLYTGVAMKVALARPAFDLYRHPEPVLASPDGGGA